MAKTCGTCRYFSQRQEGARGTCRNPEFLPDGTPDDLEVLPAVFECSPHNWCKEHEPHPKPIKWRGTRYWGADVVKEARQVVRDLTAQAVEQGITRRYRLVLRQNALFLEESAD
jgi:hypothetical protein